MKKGTFMIAALSLSALTVGALVVPATAFQGQRKQKTEKEDPPKRGQGRGENDKRGEGDQKGKRGANDKNDSNDKNGGKGRRGKDKDGNEKTNGAVPAVQSFILGLPAWGDVFLQLPLEQKGTQTFSTESVNGVNYNVQHVPTTLQSTPQDIVLFEPADGFWLGALLQETGLRQGIGAQQELPVTPEERAPLHLSNNLLLDSEAVTVARPSRSAVQEALGEMVRKAMAKGKQSKGDDFAGSFTAQVVENNSAEQTAFSLGLSAKYMGSSVRAKIASKKSATQRTLTILCIQKAFTVQTDLRGERGANAFFSDEFTEAKLAQLRKDRLIGEFNRPTYISSITYGRLILFSLTTTKDVSSLKGKLEVSLNLVGKNGASLDAEASNLLKDSSTQIDVFSVGGPQAASADMIRSGKLTDFFKGDVPLNTLTPIGYTVRTVKDNQLAAMLQTTQYDLTSYAAQAPAAVPGYRITSYFKITNSNDGVGDNNVECFGEVRINSEKAWEIPSSQAEQNKKQTGQTIDIGIALPGTRPTSYYYTTAASYTLSGFLKDSDKALNGADDTLYSFNLTIRPADLAGKGEQIFKGPSAELHIRVDKV